jgi:hypothetical protein
MLLLAVLRPVEVEVDRLVTLLFVVLKPVDRLPMLLVAVLNPVDVEVDKLVRLLFVVLRPVDRLPMLLVAVLRPVERLAMLLVAVPMLLDNEAVTVLTCRTLTASWSALPGATPVIWRLPTFTSPDELCLLVRPNAL